MDKSPNRSDCTDYFRTRQSLFFGQYEFQTEHVGFEVQCAVTNVSGFQECIFYTRFKSPWGPDEKQRRSSIPDLGKPSLTPVPPIYCNISSRIMTGHETAQSARPHFFRCPAKTFPGREPSGRRNALCTSAPMAGRRDRRVVSPSDCAPDSKKGHGDEDL